VGIIVRAFVANDKYENLVDLQIALSLQQAREELDQVKEELAAAKAHTDQYKSIAEVSEEALKQMEAVYISYKEEVLRLFFASLGKEELSEESTLM
jgi:hypothetical protein